MSNHQAIALKTKIRTGKDLEMQGQEQGAEEIPDIATEGSQG